MTSWALVADIYFLPPQTQQPDETSAQFANRVQKMIADVAKLRICDWDGYLKYYNLADKVRLTVCWHACLHTERPSTMKCSYSATRLLKQV